MTIQVFWGCYLIFWFMLSFVFVATRAYEWDYWIGHSNSGPVVMHIKKLCRIPFTGWQIHLHKMVAADMVDCHHTHPAFAVRFVLWGGYVEEVHTDLSDIAPWFVHWKPGSFGIIRPEFAHRIHALYRKTSWSLWLRGPIIAEIELVGRGWQRQREQKYQTLFVVK